MQDKKKGSNAAENEKQCVCPYCDDFDCPITSDSACKSKPTESLLCPECKRPLEKGSNICYHCNMA